VLVLGVLGCSVPALDYDGKQCPCPSGFTCNPATNTCTSGVPLGDGHLPTDVPIDQSSTSSCAGFDLCDGFEAASFAPVWMTSASITLDTTHAHRGAQAVHVHRDALAMGQGGYSQLGEAQSLATTQHVWVRAWFYLSALPASMNHFELVSIEQPTGSNLGDYLFVAPADTQIYSEFSDAVNGTNVAVPTNTWFCAVLELQRATGATGVLALTSDVLPSTTISATQTDGSPPIGDLWLGIGFATPAVKAAQPALDLWIDDVIVHHAAVTCAD